MINKKIIAMSLFIFISCGANVMSIEGEIIDELQRKGNTDAVYISTGRTNQTVPSADNTGTTVEGCSLRVSGVRRLCYGVEDSIRADVESISESSSSDISVDDSVHNTDIGDSLYESGTSSAEIAEGVQETNAGANGVNNQGIENYISTVCNRYGIDSSIVLGIARLETGNFTSYAYLVGNNPGGMSVNEVPIYYASIEEGVEAMVSNLANNYFSIGLTTPELIGQKYCPVNSNWASLVRSLM